MARKKEARERPRVEPEIVARLRAICLSLPAAYEESAWVGTRWSVGKKTFAHVLKIADGWPPAYARAANTKGPATVVTFRSASSTTDAPELARPPFFKPAWFPDIVGAVIDERTDWNALADSLTDSYAILAPKQLLAIRDRIDERSGKKKA